MFSIVELGDSVGFWGPLIVIVLIMIDLFSQPKYNWVYLLSIIANDYVNRVLKMMIREPRPTNMIHFSDYESYHGASKYGMPSGHAQSIGFSLMYLWLVRSMDAVFVICSFIGALTLYQRWKYRNHSVMQLGIGVLCGGGLAWLVYWLTTKYFHCL